jgi:hypothetical protein
MARYEGGHPVLHTMCAGAAERWGWLVRKGLWDGFATCLASVEEAPEPLGSAMVAALNGDQQVRLLVFSPGSRTLDHCSPATLLAVLDGEWLLVSGAEEIAPRLARAAFTQTLLVELTVILLYGRLKFDFVSHDVTVSAVIEFNAVMERLYREAARQVLDGMSEIGGSIPIEDGGLTGLAEGAPLRFWNALHEFRPVSQRVLATRHWPGVTGGARRWFERELASQAMLVLTECEVILISDEKTWSWLRVGRPNRYGDVVTYCPLSRLEGYRVRADDRLARLELELCAAGGGEAVQVDFPVEQRRSIGEFMEQAMTQRLAAGIGEKGSTQNRPHGLR